MKNLCGLFLCLLFGVALSVVVGIVEWGLERKRVKVGRDGEATARNKN